MADNPGRISTIPRLLQRGDAITLLLLLAWTCLFLVRTHYGFDFTDEGFYLATSDRLALGDLPFRDEQENPLRQFDVLNAAILPAHFTILQARGLGVALQITQMLALWLVLRRWLGAWVAAFAACVVPCVVLRGIWTPGYNEWATAMTVVAACGLAGGITGSRRSRIACGVVAGLGLGLAWLSYAPTALLALVPVLLVAAGLWKNWRKPWEYPGFTTGCLALALAALMVAAEVALLAAKGLIPAWTGAMRFYVAQQQTMVPLLSRIGLCWDMCAPARHHLLATIAGLLVLRWIAEKPPWRARVGLDTGILVAGIAVIIAGNLAFLAGNLHADDAFGTSGWIIDLWYAEAVLGLAASAVFVFPAAGIALLRRERQDGDQAAVALGLLAVTFLLFAIITALSSTLRALNGLHIRGALLAVGAAGFALWLRSRPPVQARALAGTAIIAQAAVAAVVAVAVWHLSFLDADPAACTAVLTRPPLAGLRTLPARARAIDAVQAWISAHVRADARMIAYHYLPGMYFAVGRRPALDWVWTDPAYASGFSGMLARMEISGHAPGLCIRGLVNADGDPAAYGLDDPIHVYVAEHFVPAVRIWPFEILVPRDQILMAFKPVMLVDAVSTAPFAATAQILLPPSSTMAPGPDGTAVITTTAPADAAAALCMVVEHGGEAISLRLRVSSETPGVFAMPTWNQQMIETDPRNPGRHGEHCPGWDVTFPAGPAGDRGFVVIAPPWSGPGAAPAARRVAFRQLSLEALPAPAFSR